MSETIGARNLGIVRIRELDENQLREKNGLLSFAGRMIRHSTGDPNPAQFFEELVFAVNKTDFSLYEIAELICTPSPVPGQMLERARLAQEAFRTYGKPASRFLEAEEYINNALVRRGEKVIRLPPSPKAPDIAVAPPPASPAVVEAAVEPKPPAEPEQAAEPTFAEVDADKLARISVKDLLDDGNFPSDRQLFVAKLSNWGRNGEIEGIKFPDLLASATRLRVAATSDKTTILFAEIPHPNQKMREEGYHKYLTIVVGEDRPPEVLDVCDKGDFDPKSRSRSSLHLIAGEVEGGVTFTVAEYDRAGKRSAKLRIYQDDGEIVESQKFDHISPEAKNAPQGYIFEANQGEEQILVLFDGSEFKPIYGPKKECDFWPVNPEYGIIRSFDKRLVGFRKSKELAEVNGKLYKLSRDGEITPLLLPDDVVLESSWGKSIPEIGAYINYAQQLGVAHPSNITELGICVDNLGRVGILSRDDAIKLIEGSNFAFSADGAVLTYQHGTEVRELNFPSHSGARIANWVRRERDISDPSLSDQKSLENWLRRFSAIDPKVLETFRIVVPPRLHITQALDAVTEHVEERNMSGSRRDTWNQAMGRLIIQAEKQLIDRLSLNPQQAENIRLKLSILSKIRDSLGEVIVPQEADVVEASDSQSFTGESAVRRMRVKRADGSEVTVFYKRPHEGGVTKRITGQDFEQKPLTPQEAFAIALQRRNEFINSQVCFGEEHIAATLFTVGTDVLASRPQIHVFQEALDSVAYEALGIAEAIPALDTPNFAQVRFEKVENIKAKGIDNLDPNDPVEGVVLRKLLEHQEALRDFYPSYVESILLGYVPDVQFYGEPIDEQFDIGLIFTHNLGFKKGEDGKERAVIFDFGMPRYDFLTVESRQRLRALIEEHKKQGELPIYHIDTQHTGSYAGIIKNTQERRLAAWYERVLQEEVRLSLAQKQPKGAVGWIKKEPEELVKDVVDKIKEATGTYVYANPSYPDRYFKDLEAFRRLSGAPAHETPVTITHEGTREGEVRYYQIGSGSQKEIPVVNKRFQIDLVYLP